MCVFCLEAKQVNKMTSATNKLQAKMEHLSGCQVKRDFKSIGCIYYQKATSRKSEAEYSDNHIKGKGTRDGNIGLSAAENPQHYQL